MKTVRDIFNMRKDLNKDEKELIKKAYKFAKKAHRGQKQEGTKYNYFIHPAYAGWLLAKWGQNHEAICAGLLHDVVEDCEVALETIRKIFGERIAFLVDGMSWERKWNFSKKKYLKDWNGFYKKICDYSVEDYRVAIVHASDEFSKINEIMGLNVTEKKNEIKRIKKSKVFRFIVPFYNEIGFGKVSEKVYERIRDFVDTSQRSRLNKFISKRDLKELKSKLDKVKGIEELK